MTSILLLKQTLRQPLRQIRKTLSEPFVKLHSESICQHIQNSTIYQNAKHIGFYKAHQGEVDLTLLMTNAQSHHKHCYLPVIRNERLLFAPAAPHIPLKKNAFGIEEPIGIDHFSTAQDLDLIFMPLVAFDSHCQRLGLGGGFYDKTLFPKPNSILVGVAYEFQWVPLVPTNDHDVTLDYVITEHTIYRKPS